MTTIFVPALLAFIITLILDFIFIPVLRRLKMGNTEREYIKEHKSKNGTPSMGGIMILISFGILGFYYATDHPDIYPVLLLTLAFGAIGYVDDFIKAVKKRSDGLKAWQKMGAQVLVTTVFAFYMAGFSDVSLEIRIPVTGAYIDFGWLAIPLLYLAVLGTVNGSNFTDGLDGLESSVTLAICGFLLLASEKLMLDLSPVIAVMAGALLAFLAHNVYPAKVFMGDTGSLALGGFVVSAAYMMQLPVFIIIFAIVYLAEVLSVILQVWYFKRTGGRRLFRMAPIHHHFELMGWSEARVAAVFTTVSLFCGAFAYFLI